MWRNLVVKATLETANGCYTWKYTHPEPNIINYRLSQNYINRSMGYWRFLLTHPVTPTHFILKSQLLLLAIPYCCSRTQYTNVSCICLYLLVHMALNFILKSISFILESFIMEKDNPNVRTQTIVLQIQYWCSPWGLS